MQESPGKSQNSNRVEEKFHMQTLISNSNIRSRSREILQSLEALSMKIEGSRAASLVCVQTLSNTVLEHECMLKSKRRCYLNTI